MMAKIKVHVQPNSSENRILGFQKDVLRLKLMAPSIENKANKALVAFLAKVLDTRKSDIAILSGQQAKDKQIDITGLTELQIEGKIEEVLTSRKSKNKRSQFKGC